MLLAPEPIVFRIGPTMGLEYFSAAALSIASCIFCHTRGTPKKRVGRTLRSVCLSDPFSAFSSAKCTVAPQSVDVFIRFVWVTQSLNKQINKQRMKPIKESYILRSWYRFPVLRCERVANTIQQCLLGRVGCVHASLHTQSVRWHASAPRLSDCLWSRLCLF